MAFVAGIGSSAQVERRDALKCSAMNRSVAAVAASAAISLSTLLAGVETSHASTFHLRGQVPSFIGPVDNRFLSVCPSTPNCISTGSDVYSKSYVPPWTYHKSDPKKTQASAVEDLKQVIAKFPEAKIVEERPVKSKFGDGYYVRAEFESKFFGFVDDLEVLFQPEKVGTPGFENGSGIVDYRSASRLGEGDFDVNRKRIKALREELQKLGWSSIGFR